MTRTAKRRRPSLIYAWGALALGGCIPELEDDTARITAPRVLAVRAVPAEAAPGDSVRLEALVASPEATRPDVAWALCTARKPLTELGPVAAECLSGGAGAQPLGAGPGVTTLLPKDACRLFGSLRPEPKPGEPAGRPVDPDPTGGYYQPVIATLQGEETLGNVRLSCGLLAVPQAEALRYNGGYVRNQNPELEALTLEGVEPAPPGSVHVEAGARITLHASWASCPEEPSCGDGLCTAGENATLCPEDCRGGVGCSGAEVYLAYDAEQRRVVTRREALIVSWYVTAGELSERRTGAARGATSATTRWTAPRQAGVARLWAVLRDDRGGVAYREVEVQVD